MSDGRVRPEKRGGREGLEEAVGMTYSLQPEKYKLGHMIMTT